MPTRLRRDLAADALRMFREQNYRGPKDIVIVDDDTGLSFPRGLTAPDVNYIRQPNLTIGEKRNMAVAAATGEIIVHWDSDDWYSRDRISHQVAMLQASGAELVGYYTMAFQDLDTKREYIFDGGGPGHAVGVSFCYWRSIWMERPFPAREEGEDADFAQGRRIVSGPAGGRIVARIHDGNTSDKRFAVARNTTQWRRIA